MSQQSERSQGLFVEGDGKYPKIQVVDEFFLIYYMNKYNLTLAEVTDYFFNKFFDLGKPVVCQIYLSATRIYLNPEKYGLEL